MLQIMASLPDVMKQGHKEVVTISPIWKAHPLGKIHRQPLQIAGMFLGLMALLRQSLLQ